MHGRWWSNDPDALVIGDSNSELTIDEVVAVDACGPIGQRTDAVG